MWEKYGLKLVPFAGILIVVLLAIWGIIAFWQEGDVVKGPSNSLTLELTNHSFHLSSHSQVLPACLTVVSSDVGGKVNWVNPLLVPGNTIGKGEPLFKMERFEYQARLSEREAALEQAKHDVAVEQADALKAVKKSYSDISKKGSESELVLRVSHRRAVASRLSAAEACVKEAEQNLADTVVVAPYTCKVVEVMGAEGARVDEGRALARIIPVQDRLVNIRLPLEDYAYLSQLDSWMSRTKVLASISLKSGEKLWWKGSITGVNAVLDADKNCAVLIASLEPNLKMPREWVIPPVNLNVDIDINIENIESSMWIPSEYLGKSHYLTLEKKDGSVIEVEPRIVGYSNRQFLVVLPTEYNHCNLILDSSKNS